LKLIIKIK